MPNDGCHAFQIIQLLIILFIFLNIFLNQTKSDQFDWTNKIKAQCFTVYDVINDKCIISKNRKKSVEVASLTKMMTCLVSILIMERLKLNAEVLTKTVSRDACIQFGTTANLKKGEQICIMDLLYGAMLPSGNDAAHCLAEYFGKMMWFEDYDNKGYVKEKLIDPEYKIDKISELVIQEWYRKKKVQDPIQYFLFEMNKVARECGMKNTRFANAHGLSNQFNKSTAEDMAKLATIAMKNQLFAKICNTQNYKCSVTDKKQNKIEKSWSNTNKLLDRGFQGVKTGQTPAAGACLCSNYKQDNVNYIIVVLGSQKIQHRFTETIKLTKYALNLIGIHKIFQPLNLNDLKNEDNT